MATATTNVTGTVTEKRKPVFKKVDTLKPGTTGHTLTVKVVSSKTVKVGSKATGRSTAMLMGRPTQPSRIAECLVGDETGTILFTARNEQGQ
uniref:Single-stranded DNA binding protein Ssb-like OB fold domain-containing protein n=1 Tax=Cannabis sativa TaxID=3483 RepID=A0A803QJJ4_CANSA